MKNIISVLVLYLLASSASAQILFEASPDAAFKKAKTLNKPVMIECYHPTCPICMALEPTLKKPEIGNIFNPKFVSVKINLSDQNQVKFLNSRKLYIPSFPTMLFFDANGSLLHSGEPQNSVEALKTLASNALDPQVQAAKMIERLNQGQALTVDQLVGIGQFSRVKMDTTLNHSVGNKLFEIYPKENLSSQESWLITSKCITDVYNGFARHWFDNVPVAAGFSKSAGHENAEQNTLGGMIQAVLYSPKARTLGLADIDFLKDRMRKLGLDQYIQTATWQATVFAAEKDKKPEIGKEVISQLITQFSGNVQSLIFIAKFVNDDFKSGNFDTEAKKTLDMASTKLSTADMPTKAEYYFELARLQQRGNDLASAKTNAKTALTNAELAKIDTKKFKELAATLMVP